MEAYMVWWIIFFRQQLKKKLYWLQIILMLAAIFCVSAIYFPSAENRSVGYCYEDEGTEDWLLRGNINQDRSLDFFIYNDKNQLYLDVVSGKIDCGFVLPETLNGDQKMICVCSPMSSKDALAKLTVFSTAFRICSEQVILQADQQIFGEWNSNRADDLRTCNQKILHSDRIFDVQLVEMPVVRAQARDVQSVRRPALGVAGVFVMMIMLVANGMMFDRKNSGLLKALHPARRRLMCMVYSLAAGIVPALIAVVSNSLLTENRGTVTEVLSMLLLVCWTLVWILFFQRKARDAAAYHVQLVLFLLVQLWICPIFADFSGRLPALILIRLFMPLGIYMYF